MTVSPQDLARTLLRRASAQRDADAEARAVALEVVTRTVRELRSQLHFGRIWIIGSLAWSGFGLRSDIDLVVENASECVLMAIAEEVGRSSERIVDVLPFENLPESFAARVVSEGQLVA